MENFKIIKPKACNFIEKESLAQVFSCEFCEISKNTYFYRTPQVTASVDKTGHKEALLASIRQLKIFQND